MLKEAIAELQTKLSREEEFNSSAHTMNFEYLVNVMRQFLMSESPSEKAHLVVVVAQLLHLKPDECRAISDKWAVKSGGGLVGWLMPKPAPKLFSSNNDGNGNVSGAGVSYADGMGALHSY